MAFHSTSYIGYLPLGYCDFLFLTWASGEWSRLGSILLQRNGWPLSTQASWSVQQAVYRLGEKRNWTIIARITVVTFF